MNGSGPKLRFLLVVVATSAATAVATAILVLNLGKPTNENNAVSSSARVQARSDREPQTGSPARSLIDFPDFSTRAQDSPSAVIKGKVLAEGYSGPVGVFASVNECLVGPRPAIVASRRLAVPGEYEMAVPQVYGTVYLCGVALASSPDAPFEVTIYRRYGPVDVRSRDVVEVGPIELSAGPPVSLEALFRPHR